MVCLCACVGELRRRRGGGAVGERGRKGGEWTGEGREVSVKNGRYREGEERATHVPVLLPVVDRRFLGHELVDGQFAALEVFEGDADCVD